MTLATQPSERVYADDPEAHPAFQAMRVAAVGRPERRMGDSVIPAEPPRWGEVRTHAAEFGSEPLHLEVLIALSRAALALDGLGGLRHALVGIADALEQHWSAMLPASDEEEPDEPWYARGNLLADLVAEPDFRDSLDRAPLVSVRGIGIFSARDLDIASGSINASDEERARCQSGIIDGAFAEASPDELLATDAALDGALEAVKRIGTVLERETGSGASSTVEPLVRRLAGLRGRFRERAESRLPSKEGNDAASGSSEMAGIVDDTRPEARDIAAAAPVPAGGPAAPTLVDHNAVRKALDDVVRYYIRHEPGSPVAVLVARSRDLVGRGFFELVGTMCPETDAGGDFVTRLGAPPRDPLTTLLAEGFGKHLNGSEPFDVEAYTEEVVEEDRIESSDAPGCRSWDDEVSGTSVNEAAAERHVPSSSVPPTRARVLHIIDEVLAFYRTHEPSSPVPLILTRVRVLVPLDFDGVLDTLRKTLVTEASDA